MMTFQRLMMASGLAFIPLLMGGCTSGEAVCVGDSCESSLGVVTQPAFLVGGFVPWSLSGGILRLCFASDTSDPRFTLSASEFANVSAHVVDVLNSTWGNVPNMHFQSGCAAPAMSIKLSKGGGYGNCGLGNGAGCAISIDPNDLASNDITIVHEVGHGLGLIHEHQRPDAQPLCAYEQTILDGCTKCSTGTCTALEATECWFAAPAASTIVVTASDKSTAANLFALGKAACRSCAQGTCAIGSCESGSCLPSDSYFGCFGRNPSLGTVQVSSADLPNAQGRVSDRSAINDGRVLTTYDSISIMNYCASENGRIDAIPTPRDMLGMEMMYSTPRVYGLSCSSGCFATGSGLLTSNDGSIVSEWIARGSLNIPFRVSGTSTDTYSYSVSGLVAGTSTVSYSFSDPVGRGRSGSAVVTKSNGSYAALSGAILASIY